ncbi:hypothetical protein AKJ62_02305 [candidate division MSBL1 archaeon SCGC-AAA259D14]|nr:hypothetical protein AKJ62_02305 [candidate division MSBL1 archaeon SCGC-AAA259D14]
MPEVDNLAPCGIYCPGCIVYKASDNEKLAEKLAENMGVDSDDVHCDGCRAEEGKIDFLSMESKCETYKCVEEKGLEFCSKCEDFPCSRLYTFRNSPQPHNSKMMNLTLMDKKGLDWLMDNIEELTELYYFGDKPHGGDKLEL